MKVSMEWLKEYVEVDASTEELVDVFPMLGMEVEGVEGGGPADMDKVVVGEVMTRNPHPEADRLKRQLRDLFYFNEAWIPELKRSELGRVQQLYDLSKDLGQQNNIVKNHPELVARMKKKAEAIYASVMADAPEWLTTEELAAAMKPRGNGPQRPTTVASGTDTAKLLARIDKNDLPKGYQGSRHQAYVDKVMAGLKPDQRARVGQLWKEKRRLGSDMPNPGASFVRILTHVAADAKKINVAK